LWLNHTQVVYLSKDTTRQFISTWPTT